MFSKSVSFENLETERFELKSEEAYPISAVLLVFLTFSCCLDVLLRDGGSGKRGFGIGTGREKSGTGR